MAESLRGGVIGAGVFGAYHASQYARLDGVVLSAVLDPHPERAAQVAVPLGGRAFHELTRTKQKPSPSRGLAVVPVTSSFTSSL